MGIDDFSAALYADALRLGTFVTGIEATIQSMRGIADQLPGDGPPPADPWRLPVGDAGHPASEWYIYTHHDMTGRRNPGQYPHTGWDCNARWGGRGNVDIGQPVYAIADGDVVDVGFSQTFRGGIVLKVDHFGIPLFVRYWHIRDTDTDNGYSWLSVGDAVSAGQRLGEIDRYPPGYAHCHFDMAWQQIMVHWWFSSHPNVEWANPTYILRAHNAPGIDEILIPG